MASGILKEQHIEGLQKLRRASCWDPLQLQVVDVEGKSEVFSKTVEMVISSNNPPSVLFMLNTEDLMKSKADGYWPNFKLMRKSDVGGKEDIVAQIQTSLEVQEFQGIMLLCCLFILFGIVTGSEAQREIWFQKVNQSMAFV